MAIGERKGRGREKGGESGKNLEIKKTAASGSEWMRMDERKREWGGAGG